jgi:YHS domain-containing protein
MRIREDEAVAKTEYRGKTYYFCAVGCKEAFEREPERYTEETEDHEMHGHCC